MAGLAERAAIVSLSKFGNYGLMLLSPVVLTHVLSIEQFGQYREFLVYATLLQGIAGFAVNDSLLYFVPAHPESRWRVLRQTLLLVGFISVLTVVGLYVVEVLLGRRLVGDYLWPLIVYTLLFVNIDGWESFWIATKRPLAVLPYATGRLLARLTVVIAAAMLTHSIEAIIWSLVALEGVRLAISAVVWMRFDASSREPPLTGLWREQLRFCLPAGTAVLLAQLTTNLSSIAVAKVLGPVALAQFTIGLYGAPIVFALRNSLSTVLLPEMVARSAQDSRAGLRLWQRAVVMNCVLLLPAAVLVWRYAEPLVVAAFGAEYRPAALLLQCFTVVMVRECFDFAPPLRALNRNGSLVSSVALGLLVNAALLALLMPRWQLSGAIAAVVIASVMRGLSLARHVRVLYQLTWREFLPWVRIAKVAACAVLAGAVLVPDWSGSLGMFGVAMATLLYALCFAVLLRVSGVAEANLLFERVRARLPKELLPATLRQAQGERKP